MFTQLDHRGGIQYVLPVHRVDLPDVAEMTIIIPSTGQKMFRGKSVYRNEMPKEFVFIQGLYEGINDDEGARVSECCLCHITVRNIDEGLHVDCAVCNFHYQSACASEIASEELLTKVVPDLGESTCRDPSSCQLIQRRVAEWTLERPNVCDLCFQLLHIVHDDAY